MRLGGKAFNLEARCPQALLGLYSATPKLSEMVKRVNLDECRRIHLLDGAGACSTPPATNPESSFGPRTCVQGE